MMKQQWKLGSRIAFIGLALFAVGPVSASTIISKSDLPESYDGAKIYKTESPDRRLIEISGLTGSSLISLVAFYNPSSLPLRDLDIYSEPCLVDSQEGHCLLVRFEIDRSGNVFKPETPLKGELIAETLGIHVSSALVAPGQFGRGKVSMVLYFTDGFIVKLMQSFLEIKTGLFKCTGPICYTVFSEDGHASQ